MHFAICIKRIASHPILRSYVLADAIIVNKLCKHFCKKNIFSLINKNAHNQNHLPKHASFAKMTRDII